MKMFEVSVRQEFGGYLRIEAESASEAEDKVRAMMDDGEIDLYHDADNIRITYADQQVYEATEMK